jgi:hypothetical protein
VIMPAPLTLTVTAAIAVAAVLPEAAARPGAGNFIEN